MIHSFIRQFDYGLFEKKLRHYFMDSAPVDIDIVMGLREITLSCRMNAPISLEIDDTLSIEENIQKIITVCTYSIYPKMLSLQQKKYVFTDSEKTCLLMQGFSLEQVLEKENRQSWVHYILVRFNEHHSTVDYIEKATGIYYRAYLYQPLMVVKDKIFELSSNTHEDMIKLYKYLISISKQEILRN
jgi:hypothetical protein